MSQKKNAALSPIVVGEETFTHDELLELIRAKRERDAKDAAEKDAADKKAALLENYRSTYDGVNRKYYGSKVTYNLRDREQQLAFIHDASRFRFLAELGTELGESGLSEYVKDCSVVLSFGAPTEPKGATRTKSDVARIRTSAAAQKNFDDFVVVTLQKHTDKVWSGTVDAFVTHIASEFIQDLDDMVSPSFMARYLFNVYDDKRLESHGVFVTVTGSERNRVFTLTTKKTD